MKLKLAGLFIFLLLSVAALGQEKSVFQRYNHLAVPVKSLSTALSFYETVLGLKAMAVPGNLASSQAWLDVGGGQQIRLVESRTDVPGKRTAPVQISLLVSSLRRTEQQLRQRGASPVRQAGPTGRPILMLTDPDGYQLEFTEGKADGPGLFQSAAKSIWRSMTDVD